LNSQPMGFYSPSQLVQDARRHGVQVLPVDVTASFWETSLVLPDETAPSDYAASGSDVPRPPVRLGFNQIKGFSKEAGLRLEAARRQGPFRDLHDLALRAALERADLERLAGADALRPLSGHRREARWHAANPPLKGLLREAPIHEADAPPLEPASEGSEILADYRALRLTLRRHPLALLR